MKYPVLALAALVAVGVSLPGTAAPVASAQQARTLHLATLAPRGSKWMRVFDAWSGSLKKATQGKLALSVEPGSASVDDRAFVRRMKAGRLDGATLAASGLSETVPEALVLAVPGLPDDPAALDKARKALDAKFQAAFEAKGYHLLGWADLGQARLFSNGKPVRTPDDLEAMKPWSRSDDVVFPAVLAAAGARPVQLPLEQVQPALKKGRVNVVPASALAAVGTGWYSDLGYVTADPLWTLVGATVVRKDVYASLPADQRAALDDTATKAHALLRKVMRSEDQSAYRTLTGRGIQATKLGNRAAWSAVARKAQARLAGRYFPASLLAQVKRAAGAR